ncbi:Hvo_1808 family surface protein [Halorhabdus sp. CUG00001]|uniref:Hvo_1808 family surface protein n=1 Tax=Halorhabdus sp. CUG00001 TaxID=2600297 RepID=UPI00131A7825|nr:Hvo_1808 family surface protein [Halorhabdus sp. CUG00001]
MVSRTGVVVVIVAVALVGVPVAGAIGPGPAGPGPVYDTGIDSQQAAGTDASPIVDQQPPDPDEDVLGWENGYWYNETLDVTPEDGLNDSELEAVVARGMARVEEIRRLEFETTPPVEVIGRDDYQQRVENRTTNTTEAQELHQNVKYEALFMINESTDAVAVQASNRAGGVGGFYDPSTGEIKIVSENTETPQMNEITLSQELFHALQDQRFNVSAYNQSTRELHNAKDGIIEGDGNYVDHLYQERCDGAWNGTCLEPSGQDTPSDFQPHLGLYQILLQPYSDGPAFVEGIREDGGWDAVNAIYENPPASTEQTIHPEKYGEDEPTDVSIPDRSDERWRPVDTNGSVDYASFGEAGLYVTLWYPAFQTQGMTAIVPLQNHINYAPDGGVDQFDPYDYNHTVTAGWDGDKLVPYVTDQSSETNETGYVYKMAWDSPEDATEFQTAYEELLQFNGAEPVDGRIGTYRIPDGQEFGDAFYLNQTDDQLVVVNAPSVEDLSAVRDGAAPDGEPTPTEASGSTTTTTSGDGFTVLTVLLAVVGLVGIATRHR